MSQECDQYHCDGKYLVFGICDGRCSERPTRFVREGPHESYCFCEAHYQFYVHGSGKPSGDKIDEFGFELNPKFDE